MIAAPDKAKAAAAASNVKRLVMLKSPFDHIGGEPPARRAPRKARNANRTVSSSQRVTARPGKGFGNCAGSRLRERAARPCACLLVLSALPGLTRQSIET
jgi:hypothetical protein